MKKKELIRMNALETLMPVLIEHGFTLKQAAELLADFIEEEMPLYLECMKEDEELSEAEC